MKQDCPYQWKKLYHKNSHQGWTQKKTYFRNTKTKIKTQNYHEPSASSQHNNNPKNVAVFFKDVKTEETFSSQDQKLVETTNLW